MTAHRSFRFEGFTLDLDRLSLHGPTGQANLRRKSFEVLRYLVEHAGRVVTKEELIAAVWPDVTVGDESLTQCVSEVRRALGHKSQRIVRTIARRGYLVDVPISASDVTAPHPKLERFDADASREMTQPDRAPIGPGGPLVAAPAQAVDGTRRQVTAMVCSFGTAALARRVDPEDLSEVLEDCHRRTREVVEAHGGFPVRKLVDGAQFVFGYPQAHEDDAERAVRAGLAVTKAAREFEFQYLAEHLQARVGIATGLVVIGDAGGGSEASRTVVGDAPLLASFLLDLAPAHSVMVAANTRRLTGTLFDYRDLGAVEIKQLPEPVEVSEVLRESAMGSRLEALRSVRGELIGRGEELDLLLRRWQQAKKGEGSVVLLTGELGMGKSRLAHALQESLTEKQHIPLIYHCSPSRQDSALHPVIAQLLRAARIERDEDAKTKLDKLDALLGARSESEDLAADMPLLAALLSIPGGDRYPSPDLTPQRLRERTLGALLRQLKRTAAQAPVVIVFEDLHWIDPTSLELLSSIVEQAPGLRLLLIATFRPEFKPPWPNHRHISTVLLTRLGRSEGQALVTNVAKGRTLPADVMEQILDRADGVPLFIEELSKTVLESGLLRVVGHRYELSGPLAELAVPATLHASLLSRLDRLATVKDVAQVGAAIGREFPYNLIAALSGRPERELQAALAQLVDAELVFQRGVPPDAKYLFKHTLVQETAYATLVRNHRRQLHGKIARTLEQRCPEIAASEPETIAYHYTEAGLTEPAISYWRRAGEHFLARSAYFESIKHLTKSIDMLKSVPETPETLGAELDTLMKMMPGLVAVGGSGSAELESLYLRARVLVDRLGRTSLRFPVLWGLWFLKRNRGQYAAAREAGDSLLDAAQASGDSGQILEAHHALWALLSVMGNAADAVRHMEHGLALYDRELHASQAFLYAGHDVGTCCRFHLAKDLWLLGHLERSTRALDDALRLAEELKHPNTTAIALWYAAWVHYHRGDRAAMKALAERLLALATEHRHWLSDIAFIFLKADACASKDEIDELHGRLQGSKAVPSYHRAFCLCVLAKLYAAGGHVEDGLAVLAAISSEDRGGYYAPEICRIEGELRRLHSLLNHGEVERCFQSALVLARQRAAKSLELRAATSLARLWRDRGKPTEAREVLEPVYDWFTEGLDLQDLKTARALLDDLASSH